MQSFQYFFNVMDFLLDGLSLSIGAAQPGLVLENLKRNVPARYGVEKRRNETAPIGDRDSLLSSLKFGYLEFADLEIAVFLWGMIYLTMPHSRIIREECLTWTCEVLVCVRTIEN